MFSDAVSVLDGRHVASTSPRHISCTVVGAGRGGILDPVLWPWDLLIMRPRSRVSTALESNF